MLQKPVCCRQSTEGWRTECGHMWFYSASYLYNLKYSNNLPGSRGSQLRSPCRRCSLAFPLRLHGRSWAPSALLPRSPGKMLISKQSSGAPAGFRDHILASLRLIWMRACPSSQNDPIQSGSHLPVPDFTSRAFQRLHLLCIPQEASLLLPKGAFSPPPPHHAQFLLAERHHQKVSPHGTHLPPGIPRGAGSAFTATGSIIQHCRLAVQEEIGWECGLKKAR